ncbi:Rrf2 family transcriptional regulator [Shimia sp. NS0008-38b]|uniref:RrF2 family transcriptional regulator n=1 Tax=Shimia sp. NS0008-38b TaxID=3127653 RepID=UPI00333ECD80
MRITKRTNIAMRVLMYCAAHQTRLVTKHEIARVCNASENHLAQVIHQLALMGVLETHRGRNGGLELAQDPKDTKIGDIFRSMEARPSQIECFADVDNSCPLVPACRLKEALHAAAEAFYHELDDLTLDALVCGNTKLLNILAPEPCGV